MSSPQLQRRDWHAQESAKAQVRFPHGSPLWAEPTWFTLLDVWKVRLHRQNNLHFRATFPIVKLSISVFYAQVYTTVSGFYWVWMWRKCCVALPKSLSTHQTPSGFHSVTLKIPSSSVLCLKETPLKNVCVLVHMQTSLHVTLFMPVLTL